MVVGLIGPGDAPAVAPLACGITWTMVGGTIIFLPDCKDQPPPQQQQPADPPPDPATPPGPPPP
jgi:hypothetical protein